MVGTEPRHTHEKDYVATPIDTATFCIVDTETTGLDPAVDRVCELAGVHWTAHQGESRRFETLVNPGRTIPPEASAIHHLVDEDVVGSPSIQEALESLNVEPFGVWVAHNADFDFKFLPNDERPILCTLKLAKKLFPDSLKHTNQYLRYALKLLVPEAKGLPAHRALADAVVTTALLRHLLVEASRHRPELRTIEDLVAWTLEPNLLPMCRFGKHSGKPWSEVPKDYLQWMVKTMTDMDPDLRFTVEHWLRPNSH